MKWIITSLFGLSLIFSTSSFSQVNIKVTTPPVSGNREKTPHQIKPYDVLARAKLVEDNVDLILVEMGHKPKHYLLFTAKNAVPREVYYQALTVFDKANALAFEYTGTTAKRPVPPKNIKPYDVWHVVNAALRRVLMVKARLGIKEQVKEVKQATDKTPSDVFNTLLEIDELLNSISAQKLTASDVFQTTTQSIHYGSRLLLMFPGATAIPKAPAFERKKSLLDLYLLLEKCFTMTEKVATDSKLKSLHVVFNRDNRSQIHIGDVYDLAQLTLSSVSYFYELTGNKQVVPKAYYPGLKLVSNAYQRAGLLLKQLADLDVAATKTPGWIKEKALDRTTYYGRNRKNKNKVKRLAA